MGKGSIVEKVVIRRLNFDCLIVAPNGLFEIFEINTGIAIVGIVNIIIWLQSDSISIVMQGLFKLSHCQVAVTSIVKIASLFLHFNGSIILLDCLVRAFSCFVAVCQDKIYFRVNKVLFEDKLFQNLN